jgi:hypothetical protein
VLNGTMSWLGTPGGVGRPQPRITLSIASPTTNGGAHGSNSLKPEGIQPSTMPAHHSVAPKRPKQLSPRGRVARRRRISSASISVHLSNDSQRATKPPLSRALPEGSKAMRPSRELAGGNDVDVAKFDGLDLFAGLSAQQLQLVAEHAVEVDVPSGKELVSDGALAWDFYVIEQGSAEVRRGEKIFRTLGPGDFFGELGVMGSDRRRTASVVSTSPVKALKLTTHQLRTLASEIPDLDARLRAAIAEREQHLL